MLRADFWQDKNNSQRVIKEKKFYEDLISQKIPNDWEVDFFVVSHRHPENENVIKEKEDVRNYTGESSDDLFLYFDRKLQLIDGLNLNYLSNYLYFCTFFFLTN